MFANMHERLRSFAPPDAFRKVKEHRRVDMDHIGLDAARDPFSGQDAPRNGPHPVRRAQRGEHVEPVVVKCEGRRKTIIHEDINP